MFFAIQATLSLFFFTFVSKFRTVHNRKTHNGMKIIPYSVNRRDAWNKFVTESKNGSFMLQRSYLDYSPTQLFDCSLMVYEGLQQETNEDDALHSHDNLLAIFPGNWNEQEACVCSHQAVPFGGLIVKPDATQQEVEEMMRCIVQYYANLMQAKRLIYKSTPHIFHSTPCEDDLFTLTQMGATLTERRISTVLNLRAPLKMPTLRQQQARKAIESGYYIDRMAEGDTETLTDYWTLLTEYMQTRYDMSPEHSLEEMQQLMSIFPRDIKLFLVRHGRDIVAGTIIFETKQVAHVQYIAFSKEGAEQGALDLLFRHLINERYKQMEYLDMGFSHGDDDAIYREQVTRKEGFGGRSICYDTYSLSLEGIADDSRAEQDDRIPYLSLKDINERFEPQLSETVARVARSGWYLLGKENTRFEEAYATHCGAKHCVAVGNGLEALTLILRAYSELLGWTAESEVIVPSNTYIASILAVTNAGLKPVLCEPTLDTFLIDPNKIEELITPQTVAIMPVHLYGRCCDMASINEIAQRQNLKVVDDMAQAHGIRYQGLVGGHLCDASGISFYPGKNLGALGDAGAVTTDDAELAAVVRKLANYGSGEKYVNEYLGHNSRMDELQAAVLTLKLPTLDADNERRRAIARMYDKGIENPLVTKPAAPAAEEEHVYHIYAVRSAYRNELQEYLSAQGIQTLVHYPIPPHKQQAYKEWNELSFPISERIHREVLSLPIAPTLTDEEVQRIIRAINKFQVE